MKKVTWFNNFHEHRNHLLKYGLMKLHRAGQVRFVVRDSSALIQYNLPEKVINHIHRHTVLLLFENGLSHKWILVDSEDSFIYLCPLIKEVDMYFCAGYNTQFFEQREFIRPYYWQTEGDVSDYRNRVEELIAGFGEHFHKVKKLVPIGANHSHQKSSALCHKRWLAKKWANLQDKVHRSLSGCLNWQNQFEMFEERYYEILSLRKSALTYDIVLSDTLWGWPHHRYSLHRQLDKLSEKYLIHSSLKWNKAAENSEFTQEQFPMLTRPIDRNYEFMLSASRLATFATGYHWGWRNIMTLALCVGLPIYMDRPILEPYFDFDQFKVFYNVDSWLSIERYLQEIDYDSWLDIKKHNQTTYDKFMAPEKVASYFLETVSLDLTSR